MLGVIARELAAHVWAWAKKKAVDTALDAVTDWVSEGADWVIKKVTGKERNAWTDTSLAVASLEAPGLGKDSWSLEDHIISLLKSKDGQAFINKWAGAISTSTGEAAQRMADLIDVMPIPRNLSLYQWADGVAAKLGVTRDYVINRRTARNGI